MRNTPFIIDFKTSCVDCTERNHFNTSALVNVTNVDCVTDLYTLIECHAKNTIYTELFFCVGCYGILSQAANDVSA
jgi:hypothetical protein